MLPLSLRVLTGEIGSLGLGPFLRGKLIERLKKEESEGKKS